MSITEQFRSVNPEQVGGIVRQLLIIGGTFLGLGGGDIVAGGGDTNPNNDVTWNHVVGGLVVAATMLWGFVARKDTNLVRSAAGVPVVNAIVAPGTHLAADPNLPKVVETGTAATAAYRSSGVAIPGMGKVDHGSKTADDGGDGGSD